MDCWNEQRIKSKRFCGICQNLGPRALFPRLIGTVVFRGRLHWLKFRIGFELELYPLVYFLHFEAARPLRCRKIKNRPHSDNYHTAQMAGSLADHSLNLDLVDAEGVDLLQAAATVHLEELFKGGQLSGRGEEIKELLHTVKESANLTSSSTPVLSSAGRVLCSHTRVLFCGRSCSPTTGGRWATHPGKTA